MLISLGSLYHSLIFDTITIVVRKNIVSELSTKSEKLFNHWKKKSFTSPWKVFSFYTLSTRPRRNVTHSSKLLSLTNIWRYDQQDYCWTPPGKMKKQKWTIQDKNCWVTMGLAFVLLGSLSMSKLLSQNDCHRYLGNFWQGMVLGINK